MNKTISITRQQWKTLATALGIVLTVFFGSAFLVQLFVPGSAAPSAGWRPELPGAAKDFDETTILSGLRIPPDTARRRLLAVMIENHEAARPYQLGLKNALMIWEFPVEGFITRFAAVFDADDLPAMLGPVRSLRPYFIDALEPWVTAVIHAGASPEAYDQAAKGDITSLNLLAHYGRAERDESVPAPHNLFIRRDQVALLPGPSLPSTPWPPYAIGLSVTAPEAFLVHLNFYNPNHDITYTYSRLHDAYIRSSGPVEDQGRPRNVLILEMPVTGVGEMGRLTIPVSGRGRALLFSGGRVQAGMWSKKNLTDPFSFTATDGNGAREGTPLLFAPGQTWVTVLPGFDRVRWN